MPKKETREEIRYVIPNLYTDDIEEFEEDGGARTYCENLRRDLGDDPFHRIFREREEAKKQCK